MSNTSRSGEGWTLSFQRQVAAAVWRDPVFLPQYHELLRPDYFDSEALSRLVEIAFEYYRAFFDIPREHDHLISRYCERKRLDIEVEDALKREVRKLLSLDLASIRWIEDEVEAFGNEQAFRGFLEMALSRYDEGQVDRSTLEEIRSDMERILTLGKGTHKGALNFAEVLSRLPDLNKENTLSHRIPTGFKILDEALNGGLGVSEVGIWAAPPAAGKSLILANIACFALVSKVPVFICTAELKALDYANRMASRLTLTPVSYIQNPKSFADVEMFRAALKKFLGDARGLDPKLCEIKHYAGGTASCSTIRSYLSYLYSTKGFKPKVIIMDYADKFVPSVKGKVKEALLLDGYNRMGAVMEEMEALGDAFESNVWTGSQYNRSGMKSTRQGNDIGDMHDLADSMKKSFDASVLVTVAQTLTEYDAGVARALIAKDRRGKQGIIIDLDMDYSIMRVRESSNQHSHAEYYADRREREDSDQRRSRRGSAYDD